MRLGISFPQYSIGADIALIRDFVQAAEALGYSHLVAADHVLGAVHEGREVPLSGAYTEATEFHEPLVLFGYLAGITRTIEFMTGVLVLGQRQTALVAKQAAELQILSGGRFRLGVGVGWNHVEYQALNEDFHTRGRRQEEQVAVIRALLRAPVVDFSGTWHRIDRAGIRPLPPVPVPVWLGGRSEAAYRRAGRIADGFYLPRVPGGGFDRVERLRAHVTAAGRDPGSFGIEVGIPYELGREGWQPLIDAWLAAGATHLHLRLHGVTGEVGALVGERLLRALQEFHDQVDYAWKT